ncbi:hypothetical protein AURDEDRAFT_164295 [Auricularia subglabra TFB-10046 SS5]|nr:hypothetical protein AURDEDRAFT_164295 [Auricularia subglabra TFB-10046 SS5]
MQVVSRIRFILGVTEPGIAIYVYFIIIPSMDTRLLFFLDNSPVAAGSCNVEQTTRMDGGRGYYNQLLFQTEVSAGDHALLVSSLPPDWGGLKATVVFDYAVYTHEEHDLSTPISEHLTPASTATGDAITRLAGPGTSKPSSTSPVQSQQPTNKGSQSRSALRDAAAICGVAALVLSLGACGVLRLFQTFPASISARQEQPTVRALEAELERMRIQNELLQHAVQPPPYSEG